MPLHLPPLSRRGFLVRSLAAGTAGLLSLKELSFAAEDGVDANRFALLADTHIPNGPSIAARGVNMTDHLRRVGQELVALSPKPAGVIINGDCAYLAGFREDYVNLAGLLEPIGQAGLPVHLTMGNHDDRGPFYEVLADQRPENPPLESRHVTILETPRVNLILLDSLWRVNVVTGEIGREQLDWLAAALDARADKPAVVIAHHDFQWDAATADRIVGLRDSDALFEILKPRKHVKAYLFGHRHRWTFDERDGIHLINLPAVAYVFGPDDPSGWVDAHFQDDRLDLELRCLDKDHLQHGEQLQFAWRA
jgi:3',5'-cyclic-AMP phosphodiesterase